MMDLSDNAGHHLAIVMKGGKPPLQNLELLKQLAHGFAVQFGPSCEVLIHDIKQEDIESSIVYIENGHVSNRKLGDGPSKIVLESLTRNPDELKDRLSYLIRSGFFLSW